jgi:hypothetical protein
LSRRLRQALLEHYLASGSPDFDAHVLPEINRSVFRRTQWRRILKRSKIGHRTLKDLRDTFASQLLSAAVPLGYVSKQLGHADVGVTVRHYARYVSDDYREPPRLEPGEVPADLLARLGESHHTHISKQVSDGKRRVTTRNPWWSQRESNPTGVAVSP